MPPIARPWRRKDTGAWQAHIDGRRVTLAPKTATQTEASKVLRELLCQRDRGRLGLEERRTVAELVARFVADCRARVGRKELAPDTLTHYRNNLRFFGPAFGHRVATELRPHDIGGFLDGHPRWNSTTRASVITTIKRVYSWARKQGLIDLNPLADLEKPQALRRTEVVSPEGVARAFRYCLHPSLRVFLQVLHETGCRPAEARTVTAADLDLQAGCWRQAGKTTRRTGQDRVVWLNPAMLALFRELAEQHPTGPLLRNARGKPWKPSAINSAMARLRGRMRADRIEPGKSLVPYSLRHRFVTDGLLRGLDAATVAKLSGHTTIKMVAERYSHLNDHAEFMRAAASRVRESGTKDAG